jgi:hypothetical protein
MEEAAQRKQQEQEEREAQRRFAELQVSRAEGQGGSGWEPARCAINAMLMRCAGKNEGS